MSIEQQIAIACDADLRANTAIGRKIASNLTLEEAKLLTIQDEDEIII